MLVLSRMRDQEIVITTAHGEVIRIVVVEFRTGPQKVRLGFDAAPEVKIHRREVYDAIQHEGGD